MSLTDKLNELINAKADMKAAIESKGVEVTGGLSTYADAIRNIESGGDAGTWKISNNIKFSHSQFTSIPAIIDTSNVTDAWFLFGYCSNLNTVRAINTSKMTDWWYMFFGSNDIDYVDELDASNVFSIAYMFGNTTDYACAVTDLKGFTNLGKPIHLTGFNTFLYGCYNLTRESLINVFNKLYDRKSAGYSVVNIKLHYDALKRLTSDDIAIATNKGWTVSS